MPATPMLHTLLTHQEYVAWKPFLEKQCREMTTLSTTKLDTMLGEVSKDVSVRNSTLYCSTPVLALLRSRAFLCGMLLVSLFYVGLVGFDVSEMAGNRQVHATTFRFTVLEHRDPMQAASADNIEQISVKSRSCTLIPSSTVSSQDSITLRFPTKVAVSGWDIVSGTDRALDVRKMRVEAGPDTDTLSTVRRPVWEDTLWPQTRPDWTVPLADDSRQRFEFALEVSSRPFLPPILLLLALCLSRAPHTHTRHPTRHPSLCSFFAPPPSLP